MSKHTMEPWTVHKDQTVVMDDGQIIAIPREGTIEEIRALAHMVASLPETIAELDRTKELNAELLAALEHVKECLRPFIDNPEKGIVKGSPMNLSVICQAIAKAKGKQCTTPK